MMSKKLSDKKGISLVFAIIAVLVIVTLSSIIIASARINIGRIEKRKRQEQVYLSVSSAAELIKDSFADDEIVCETTYTYDVTTRPNSPNAGTRTNITYNPGVSCTYSTDANTSNPLQSMVCSWISTTITYGTNAFTEGFFTDDFVIKATFPSSDGSGTGKELSPVHVSATIEGLDLVFVLYAEDENDPDINYTMTVAVNSGYNLNNPTEGSYVISQPVPEGDPRVSGVGRNMTTTQKYKVTTTYTIKYQETGIRLYKGEN